ncbi:MAG TPA: PqqD family peptide modification chaperone [Longimicrobiales bacterium]|nr:PqqD family peptide modification chaperone [Longimicrobiales bacterium]
MSVELTEDTVLRASPDQVSCDLQGEAALLNLKTGVYYGLDKVGASAWNIMQRPVAIRQIRQHIVDLYDVDAATAAADLDALIRAMIVEGLIVIEPPAPSV